jgi:hypothetical protein
MRFVCVKRALMEETFADSFRMLSQESVQPAQRKPVQNSTAMNRAWCIILIPCGRMQSLTMLFNLTRTIQNQI